jgi:serine/threonine protein kinase
MTIPKISDLGMARFTSVGIVLSKTPEVQSKEMGPDGKPFYFPEHAACKISHQSDVYSVGVVVWSLIMRRLPDRPGAATFLSVAPDVVSDLKLRALVGATEVLNVPSALRCRFLCRWRL